MKHHTAIEWTHFRRVMPDGQVVEYIGEPLNFVFGCRHASPGCQHCYAETMAQRLAVMGNSNYQAVVGERGWNVEVRFDPKVLTRVERMEKPRCFFTSMTDPFYERMGDKPLVAYMETVLLARRHLFILLTKRPDRLRKFIWRNCFLFRGVKNLIVGASAENQEWYEKRLDDMEGIVALREREWLTLPLLWSLEPLLGPITLSPEDPADWIIVGGESGPGARPMEPDWVRALEKQSHVQGTPFFFKQWGGERKHETGSLLDGREWKEFPAL